MKKMFDKDFKLAIQNLPGTEKDKLILRLLKLNPDLANRLYFELVDTETAEQKREKLAAEISKKIHFAKKRFYSMGYFLMDVRYISGDISEHLRITKDKIGEITLNIQLLTEVLTMHKTLQQKGDHAASYKLYIYILARAFKILILIKALHEDYLLEFKDSLKKLGDLIADDPYLMKLAINNGFDVNWLYHEIPNDISQIHKQIKDAGFLK